MKKVKQQTKQKNKQQLGQRWDNISIKEERVRLLPRVCEAVLYIPQLTNYFFKIHKKYVIVNDNVVNNYNLNIHNIFHYGIYDYNDIKIVLSVLIEAENNEELRWDIFKRLATIKAYSDTLYCIEDVTSLKNMLDGYLKYYYTWLYFSLPTKNGKEKEDETVSKKDLIYYWEIENNKTDKVLNELSKALNTIVTPEDVYGYEKILIDLFIKNNFKYIDLTDLLTPKLENNIIMSFSKDNTDSYFKNIQFPIFKCEPVKIPEELIKIKQEQEKEFNFQTCLEYQLLIYHTFMFYQGRNILELMQKQYIKKTEFKKVVVNALFVTSMIKLDNFEHFEFYLGWNIINNIFTLMLNKERDSLVIKYEEISNKKSNENKNNEELKLRKVLEAKDAEIEKLKKCIVKGEEKTKSEVIEYRRKAKDQEKIIYELNKAIEELKNKEIEENREISVQKKNQQSTILIKKEERVITEEEFRNVIKSHNICIYGGIPKWQNKIKNKYPDLHMMEVSDTVPLKPLDKAFMIIYVNIWTSHCAWERVVSYAESLGLPKGHLNNYNEKFLWETVVKEVERVEREIIKAI